MTTGIYYIKNTVNGKVYVGSSNNIEQRINYHKSYLKNSHHPNHELQKDFNNQNNLDDFEFKLLEKCGQEKLENREDYYMKKFNSVEEGYNCYLNENMNQGKNNPMHGKTHDQKTVNEILNKRRNYDGENNPNYNNGEVIEGVNNPFYGKEHTQETKEKIRENHPQRKLNEESVKVIKYLIYNSIHSQRKIAQAYGISPSLITMLKKGEVWENVSFSK